MDTRREFVKKAALLSGGIGFLNALPASVRNALAINPAPGSTYMDAEHIVLLMQENRSFDHCFGSLKGVRGFNDPRAIALPDKNPVWLQTNAKGETYAPFRLNIKDTKATWMSSLPHGWEDQTDARNNGHYDKWLDAKPSGNEEYHEMPLTMGFYNRQDIPFYYALADAFTVCDQNFCSSLTGTTPNRLHFWTGTIRSEQNASVKANVKNEDVDYGKEVKWKSFPERLEENDISWKIYQNEISLPSGLAGEEDAWLANFTDNPIEWFSQYNVKFSETYIDFAKRMRELLPVEIAELEKKIQTLPAEGEETDKAKRELEYKKRFLEFVTEGKDKWTKENFEKLSQFEKNLHSKAFTTNKKDPHYRELLSLEYNDESVKREMLIPKGDVLHQFREDVKSGNLPTVSWIVAPENFSDHPGAPWYGAWYISEVMDILTQNPEVWKKTIFILAYDENDGYFDHVPPYVPPLPGKPETGKVSKGIDTAVEHVKIEQELQRKRKYPERDSRSGPIGLGYRVPLVIASPWSRGGAVNSEIFDHTSSLRFLEKFINQKYGKKIAETNISEWRKSICGDLTSVFKPYNGEKIEPLSFPERNEFLESIHKAKFKANPSGFKLLSQKEINLVKSKGYSSSLLPQQEKGIRTSCPIAYELYADGRLSDDKKTFRIKLTAGNKVFGEKSLGSPFHIYTPTVNKAPRSYMAVAGDSLTDEFSLTDFSNQYHFCVYGPNGFFREFKGNEKDALVVSCTYQLKGGKPTGNIELKIKNTGVKKHTIEIKDNAYKAAAISKVIDKGAEATVILNLSKNYNWYDFSVRAKEIPLLEKRYAGHVETGKESKSDPFMGRMV